MRNPFVTLLVDVFRALAESPLSAEEVRENYGDVGNALKVWASRGLVEFAPDGTRYQVTPAGRKWGREQRYLTA